MDLPGDPILEIQGYVRDVLIQTFAVQEILLALGHLHLHDQHAAVHDEAVDGTHQDVVLLDADGGEMRA